MTFKKKKKGWFANGSHFYEKKNYKRWWSHIVPWLAHKEGDWLGVSIQHPSCIYMSAIL